MKPRNTLRERLRRLPPLDRANAAASSITCKVCGGAAAFFDVVDFNKCVSFYSFGPAGVVVPYYRCSDCGFLFTPFCDGWSQEDFARIIYNDDYALVDPSYVCARAEGLADTMAQRLAGFEEARILDYGAGSGAFARRMTELGFAHISSYDPFSIPERPDGRFDIVTCFEVIEHSPTPRATLEDMLSFLEAEGCILLGETMQPPDIDVLRGNWWYVAPRNGHVSTFADRTLVTLAERLGLVFYRGDPHVFLHGRVGAYAELAARFATPLACFRLGAPGAADRKWFPPEQYGPTAFQWTSADRLTWRVNCPPGPPRLVQIMVPFVHESREGFAAECRIELGGQLAGSIRESCIFAEFNMQARRELFIALHTPSLQTSRDGRRLGIGIPVSEQT